MRSALLFALAAPALAAPTSPVTGRLDDVTFSGAGCADGGRVKVGSTTFGDSVSIDFGGIFKDDSSVNCQLHSNVFTSQGWQYAFKDVTYHGDAYLKPDTTLSTSSSIFFSQDAANTDTFKGQLVCQGPEYRDSFSIKSSSPSGLWSKCAKADGYTGILNVNHRPVITGNGGNFNIKSATWRVEWRKC